MLNTRRDFLKLGTAAIAGVAAAPAFAAKRSASDIVTLGNSGVKVSRLAFGTGTHGGRVQRELGQEAFTKLVRHAYDNGIRFFETAESYQGMPQMLGTALKGIPRDSYRLMTKYRFRPDNDPLATIQNFRSDLNTDYFDILLLHCVRNPAWPDQTKAVQDAFSEAKEKKLILTKGASVHGLQGLRTFPENKWIDVALMRVNHNGTRMDTMSLQDIPEKGDVNEVFTHAKKIHGRGVGIMGMKLVGEGQFTSGEDRQAALNYVFKQGCVDAVTMGFKSTAEIDEAISRMDQALNA